MEMGQLFLGCAYNSGEIVFCSAVRGEKEEKKTPSYFTTSRGSFPSLCYGT